MRDRTDSIEAALVALAGRVEIPATPRLAASVGARLRADAARGHRPAFARLALWSRRRLVAATALGLVLVGCTALAARLAIGAVQVRVVATLTPSAPSEAPGAFGEEVALNDAVARTGIQPGWPPSFGPPDDAYVVRTSTGVDALVLGWREAERSPTIPGTPWSALLIEMRGPAEIATKYVLADAVHPARVHGGPAVWITGPHDLALRGAFGDRTLRVRGNVLIWQGEAGITYRLETMLRKDPAVRLAETLRG